MEVIMMFMYEVRKRKKCQGIKRLMNGWQKQLLEEGDYSNPLFLIDPRREKPRMKNIYPVFFTKTDTVILVEVPDLEILTEGKNMVNAIEMARDAIELKCVSMEDDGMEIPMPSEISELDIANGTFAEDGSTVVSLVDIDSEEYRRKIDTRAVRKNVTIPSWLNYEAEHAGINVSKVLQEALMNVLNVQRNF